MPEPNDTEFRIGSDPSVSITQAEVDAQRAAIEKLDNIKRRGGQLVEADPAVLREQADEKVSRYRSHGVASENVRAGMNPNIRMPDEESIQAAIEAGDMETAHLMRLQMIKPGTPEFMAKAPPGEEVIEVIGPKGAEGFGIVERQVGTGPNAGKLITHFQEPEPLG